MRALSACLVFFLCTTPGLAAELIRHFHSNIGINADGTMTVQESIRVTAEGRQIKRGIYRDFPTDYRDRAGNRYRVGFEVDGVLRNGSPEHFHQQRRDNGVRVYFGHKERELSPGKHDYDLRYTTNRQLGFFSDHDELYWNVTGNGWDFPIDKASAMIRLPPGVPTDEVSLYAYTGAQGSTGQDYRVGFAGDNYVVFETTRPLAAREGLTIVAAWPKGFVTEPEPMTRINWVLQDNAYLLLALGGLLLILGYYAWAWHRVGRDPEAGPIMTHYFPPEGYSPASMRYIARCGAYDKETFAAAVINLAVKGFLRIEQEGKTYTLHKTGSAVPMAPGEEALQRKLFSASKKLKLEQANRRTLNKALKAHEASLSNDYEKKYFFKNTGFFLVGLLLSLLLMALALFFRVREQGMDPGLFILLWLTPWTICCLVLLQRVINALGARRWGQAFSGTLSALPFWFFEVMVATKFMAVVSWSVLALLVLAAAINWLFYELLKAPTLAGRRLLDGVDGFKDYLELAEKDELAFKHPAGKTPQLFEMYLPYALALGVEQTWAEKFTAVFAAGEAGSSARPHWYSGNSWNNNDLNKFTSDLGSGFVGSISSASAAPGSSSGGGGGGVSGGGGGGGGGGGW